MLAKLNTDLEVSTLTSEKIFIEEGTDVVVEIIYTDPVGTELAVISNRFCIGMVIPTTYLYYTNIH